jgi:hypothetical protein
LIIKNSALIYKEIGLKIKEKMECKMEFILKINKLFTDLLQLHSIKIRKELFLLKEDKEIMEVSKNMMLQIKVSQSQITLQIMSRPLILIIKITQITPIIIATIII